MGREIRKVVPDWQHPRYTQENAPSTRSIGQFIPMHDESYQEARAKWLDELAKWEVGEDPDRAEYGENQDWWEWHGNPPERDGFRPHWTEEEATWWQAYETVSEGTPISPPFPTPEQLIDWLCTNKDYWGYGPQAREGAERFVRRGWAPSAIINVATGEMRTGIDALMILPG
jgi:hypothetical protein